MVVRSERQATQGASFAEEQRLRAKQINIGSLERLVSVVGGVFLVAGLKNFKPRSLLRAALGGECIRRGVTGHSNLYSLLDITSVHESPGTISAIPNEQGIRVQYSRTIARPAEQLYTFWRAVENAPQYMYLVESVQPTGETTAHWKSRSFGQRALEWDSEITQDEPNRLIDWRITSDSSLSPLPLGSGGCVRFEPTADGNSTIVTLTMDFHQPGGLISLQLAKLFGRVPEQIVRENLRNVKELMETGEVATIKGQPVGAGQQPGIWQQ
jgi:uncharacterized membrane protein